jgi:hypothetical protein
MASYSEIHDLIQTDGFEETFCTLLADHISARDEMIKKEHELKGVRDYYKETENDIIKYVGIGIKEGVFASQENCTKVSIKIGSRSIFIAEIFEQTVNVKTIELTDFPTFTAKEKP